MTEFSPDNKKELRIEKTNIPDLLVVHLPVHGDSRGWFKENWQREKMVALGLPDFHPVQNNISFNAQQGVTRGIHAEPWDKYVSVANGKVFGFWVDLREGNQPEIFTLEVDPSTAVFVPRGVANGYQSLEDNTTYTYLVNDHWQPSINYPSISLDEIADKLPIPLNKAEISEKDKNNLSLSNAERVPLLKTFITGGNGQLGKALQEYYPNADYVDLDNFDISNEESYKKINWANYTTLINAAAYTNVDGAETLEGREIAWASNAKALQCMARVAMKYDLTLVHISTDYVFDGTKSPHHEDEPFTPLSVYGQSKAAGDLLAATALKHYIFRTSWVIGRGKNFIKTMFELAQKEVEPKVVNDQLGRLTFAEDLARAIHHLLSTKQEYGTYNMTNDGKVVSWENIAKLVFEKAGNEPKKISGISTKEYFKGKEFIAPRPLKSELDLSKIKATGFQPRDWQEAFDEYMKELKEELK